MFAPVLPNVAKAANNAFSGHAIPENKPDTRRHASILRVLSICCTEKARHFVTGA
jgi:hypothetical protein